MGQLVMSAFAVWMAGQIGWIEVDALEKQKVTTAERTERERARARSEMLRA